MTRTAARCRAALERVPWHRFDPYFESDSPCWCGRAGDHPIHRGRRTYPSTAEGQLPYLTAEQTRRLHVIRRRNSALARLLAAGRLAPKDPT